MEFSERRRQICEFIAQFRVRNGFAPTIREIGAGVGMASTSAVQYQILALERLGALSRREGYSRTIVLAPRLGHRKFKHRSRERLYGSGSPIKGTPTVVSNHAE
jgi:SOS-response transcriptional repressor LexA